ncbi:NAD(P)-dependent oxidoreductase [Streptomyces malaysiensis subsp. malaysiensis]|uniref:NAD(P)-dependent oxidoreductase n=1 Tax=Streptomyces malaysiensis TaxID=92644 RepID=A0ABX6WHC8_STRMQ|nr:MULTISPECIES: NAD(P)-dependent oxidoreductase [Streptomyces]QPI60854.1 NAD(P)-dependent oxidoreductase [Streptomyces solisilvae]UHH22588.1 NAD(P)-dependent oxidoreductase [Streptomyces sp. HNM0561]
MRTGGDAPTVAVVGLGPMGAPVARHIARAGFPLQVWNRTPARAEEFGDRGVAHPADLRARVVLSVLPDIDQLDEIAPDPVVRRWAGHGTAYLVVLSTTSPDKVRRLAGRLGRWGVTVLDAPMSGGDAGARAGTLSLMVGAAPEAYACVEPVLRSFAATVELMGPPGAGTAAKLCNQVIVAGTLVAVAEAVDLGRRAGLSGEQLVRVLRGGLAASAVLDAKAAKILHREYGLGGSTVNQVKDLRYATGLADALGARLPQTRHTRALFEEALRRGLGAMDHAAVYEAVRAEGGTARGTGPPPA